MPIETFSRMNLLPCALETQLLKGLHKVENLASEKSFRQTFKPHLGLVINEALLRVGN
jgi:hypothetical protein